MAIPFMRLGNAPGSETSIYFAGGGFDVRNCPNAKELAAFIVTACNEHHQLLADKAQHRAEMLAIVAKVAAAGIAMDQADKVQGMLIDALKAARNTITGMGYSTEDIDGTMARINEALQAADGLPG